jgi:heme exporter protein D
MPELGPHASFIIWAYLGVLVGVAALILSAGIEARRVRSRLKALEARGLRRRSEQAP